MRIFIYFLIFMVMSCASKGDNYLNKGLYELENKTSVNDTIAKGLIIKTFGVIISEEKDNTYDLVFMLNNDVTKEIVEGYSATIRIIPVEAKKPNKTFKPGLILDFKPKLMERNGHKYMIKTVTTKLRKVKELRLTICHNIGYQTETISESVVINNVLLY